MSYEEKLELIIGEIVEAKKRTRSNQATKIFVDNHSNILKKICLSEIYEILLKLQDDGKLINVLDCPNSLKKDHSFDLYPNNDHFLIEILENFDSWYEEYLLAKKSKLDNIDLLNLLKIYDVVLDIEEKLQMSESARITIKFFPRLAKFTQLLPVDNKNNRSIYESYIEQGITYLVKKCIIKERSEVRTLLGNLVTVIEVDLDKFNHFLNEIKEEYKKRQDLSKRKEQGSHNENKMLVKSGKKVFYDASKGELVIEDKQVKFSKDSFRAKLLELILKNEKSRKKEWSWDEAIEIIEGARDIDQTKKHKKKFYPACDGITKQIASKIGVNDLLLFSKSSVRLNPKYL